MSPASASQSAALRSVARDAPRPALRAVPLASLEPGSAARVEAVEAEAALAGRLLDLGFLPGTPVQVVRRAPLGDPTVYELRGYRVCLRREEGACIQVLPA